MDCKEGGLVVSLVVQGASGINCRKYWGLLKSRNIDCRKILTILDISAHRL